MPNNFLTVNIEGRSEKKATLQTARKSNVRPGTEARNFVSGDNKCNTFAMSSSSALCFTNGFVSTGLLISASFCFSSFRRLTAATRSGSSFGCQQTESSQKYYWSSMFGHVFKLQTLHQELFQIVIAYLGKCETGRLAASQVFT
jgi:hypothetical protein